MKLTKKISSLIIAGSMIISMFPANVYGAAEPVSTPEIKYFNDFSEDKTYFSGTTGYMNLEETEDYFFGQALKINPVADHAYIDVKTPMTDSKDFSLSFDFKAGQEDHPLVMFSQESGNTRVAAINYDVKGNLVINSKAGSFANASGNYSSATNLYPVYVGTDWTNISMHFHPDGYNTTIDWYINGEFVVTSTSSNVSSGREFTGGMDTFHIGTTRTGANVSDQIVKYDETEFFLIDNYKIEYLDDEYVYANLNAEVGTSTTVFPVSFSENLDMEIGIDDIEIINTENGESVSVVSLNGSSKKFGRIEIEVSDSFKADTEYFISFPENLKGVSGKKLYSNMLYFIPKGVASIECPEITDSILNTEGDCEDLPIGTLEGLNPVGNWAKYLITDWKYDISAVNTGTEENPNTAIKFSPDHTSTQFFRMETDGKNALPFLYDINETSVVWSADIMRKELTRSYPMMFIMGKSEVGSASVGYFFFDSYGNFVFLNGSGDWWSTEDYADVNSYSSKQTAYNAGIKAGEWVNITAVINSKDETVTYFVNKEYAGKGNWPSNRKGKGYNYFSGMRINPEDMYRDGRTVYFDNYKLGYAKTSSNKITSFRVFDRTGNSYGPMDESVSADIRKLEITASADIGNINDATVSLISENDEEVEISNPKVSGKKISFDVDECLKKNMRYEVFVDGLKTSEGEDIKTYENSFKTSANGEFVITAFELVSENGNVIEDALEIFPGESVYLKVSAVNTTDDIIRLNASVTGYNNAILSADNTLEIQVGANSRDTEETIEIVVESTSDLYVVATLTDEAKRTVKPMIEIGEMSVNEDVWTLSFEDKTEGNTAIYTEILSPAGETQTVVYRGQTISDKDGNFKVVVRLSEDAKSGIYKFIWTDENGNTGTETAGFANSNDTGKIIEKINTSLKNETKEASIATISGILSDENNRYAMGIISENIEDIDLMIPAEIIYNEFKNNSVTENEAVAHINKAIYMTEIVSGKADNLFENADILGIKELKLFDFIEKSFITESFEKSVTAQLYIESVKKFSDFYEKLTEKFVLETVKNPDGEDNLIEVMKSFSKEIGITDNGKDKAYRAVMYNTYKDYDALKKAFEDANKENTSPGGGGGGGGGGSSSGGSSKPVMKEIYEEEAVTEQQIPYPVFSDIADVNWASEAITRLAEMQIVNGKGDHKFCPYDKVTRAELVKMIVLALEYETKSSFVSSFNDVPEWAKSYVDSAFSNGIVTGYDETTFGGSDYVTRQDMAIMIYRAAVNKGIDFVSESSNVFSDSSAIADYAKDAVHTLYNVGVINGVGTGMFSPKSTATRAEVAKIIYSIIKL